MAKGVAVSVIIPTLNEERYIESCLRSLKNQDYADKLEIIVADGGSKDETRKIAEKYADKVLLVKRRGISVGRNEGAKIAKGEILIFIDADTIVMPNTIRELIKAFANKAVVGATCFLMPDSMENRDLILYFIYNNFIRRSLKTKSGHMTGACTACRKYSFDIIDGYNESLKALEDFDFSERLGKLGKLVFTDKTFVVVSTRRIASWGRVKSVKKYMGLYLNRLTKGRLFNGIAYRQVRKI